MSKARRERYGWTPEKWAAYKRWAVDYCYELWHSAARKVTAQIVEMGGYKPFDMD